MTERHRRGRDPDTDDTRPHRPSTERIRTQTINHMHPIWNLPTQQFLISCAAQDDSKRQWLNKKSLPQTPWSHLSPLPRSHPFSTNLWWKGPQRRSRFLDKVSASQSEHVSDDIKNQVNGQLRELQLTTRRMPSRQPSQDIKPSEPRQNPPCIS